MEHGPIHVAGHVHLGSLLQKVPGQLQVVLGEDGSAENGVALVVDDGVHDGSFFHEVLGDLRNYHSSSSYSCLS